MNKKIFKQGGTIKKVDLLFNKYADSHHHALNILYWISIPLITFGIFGLIWSIPFPYLPFLGKFNGFINWASFTIGVVIFYYYKLSPTLSYGMLLIVGLYSYFIVQLEYWEIGGGPAMWFVCFIIFITAWIGQFIGHKLLSDKAPFSTDFKFFLVGPIWLLAKFYKALKIPY